MQGRRTAGASPKARPEGGSVPQTLSSSLYGHGASLRDPAVPGANSGLLVPRRNGDGRRSFRTKVGSRGDGPPSAAVWAGAPQFVAGSYKTPRPNGGRRRGRPRAARLSRSGFP